MQARIIGLAVVFSFFSSIVQACMHVPLGYGHEVTYATEEIFMYHDGRYAHMIIKSTIQVDAPDLPETIGWIIPVQSIPVDYKEADAQIFKSLFDYVEFRKAEMTRGMQSLSLDSSQGLILHEKQFVGHYEIQPIELTDYSSGKELLDWFNDNGFKTKNKDIDYYLKNHYAYLAIKITDLHDQKEELKPLHIVYKSDELSVPLKFDSLSGTFTINLYFLTGQRLGELDKDRFGTKHLKLDGRLEYPIKFIPGKTGNDILDKANLPRGYLYKFNASDINSSANPLKDWSEDPAIKINWFSAF